MIYSNFELEYTVFNFYSGRIPTDHSNFQIRGKKLDRHLRSTKLSTLYPDTRYLICVLALGNWISASYARHKIMEPLYHQPTLSPFEGSNDSGSHLEIFDDSVKPLLVDSTSSKCAEVITLNAPVNGHVGEYFQLIVIYTRNQQWKSNISKVDYVRESACIELYEIVFISSRPM